MPQSRKRKGHHPHKKFSTAVPSSQRTKGTTIWAVLVGVGGLAIAYFAAGLNYGAMAAGLVVGVILGYALGRQMEKDASGKS